MPVLSSLSASLLCVCLHCTVLSATHLYITLQRTCVTCSTTAIFTHSGRLRHTNACYIHVSFAPALTETRRSGSSFFYFIVEFWWCLKRPDPEMWTFGVFGLSCETSASYQRQSRPDLFEGSNSFCVLLLRRLRLSTRCQTADNTIPQHS